MMQVYMHHKGTKTQCIQHNYTLHTSNVFFMAAFCMSESSGMLLKWFSNWPGIRQTPFNLPGNFACHSQQYALFYWAVVLPAPTVTVQWQEYVS